MGRLAVAEPVLAGRERLAIGQGAGFATNEVIYGHQRTNLAANHVRLGPAPSHSFSAPHSSDSKWLKLICRKSETSMSRETASRISLCIPLNPVWNSSGSSSFTRKWLN